MSLGASSSPTPAIGPVTGVVWDLGNVLIDWDPFPAVAYGVGEEAARRFFAEVDFGAWNFACDAGGSWDEAVAWLERHHPEHAEAGRSYPRHFDLTLRGAVPGTPELVRALHDAGVPQSALTNWSAELYPRAPERFDFIDLFDDVVVSGEVGLAKPDPAIYTLACERIGRSPGDLVFIDDRPTNTEAAAEVGMATVTFTDAIELRRALAELGLPL